MRNCVCRSIHQFFQERGFLYVHTPIITASDCEGAGADVPGHHARPRRHRPSDEHGAVDFAQDFFGRPAYLTVSGQLEAETFACALGKIYTFGPTFRAENSNTPRHLAEFWMVEPEMAFCDLADDMDLAEDFLRHLFRDVLENCPEDMEFFNERIDNTALIATLEEIIEQRVPPHLLHRGRRHPREVRRSRSSSRSPGATTCRPSTSAT